MFSTVIVMHVYMYVCVYDSICMWGREMTAFGSSNKADKAHALGCCFLF